MSQATSTEEIADEAGTQFAVIRSLCYPDSGAVSAGRPVETFSRRTTTHAETDGRNLKINAGFFQKKDMETRFVTLLHEVTHVNDGSSFGRGDSAHSPTFWEEFQRNFNLLAESPRHRRVIESVFTPLATDFNWYRARYRAVQHVSQTDKRSETVEERRRKLADAIGYDGYEDFENGDWGIAKRKNRMPHPDDPVQVNLFVPATHRYAEDFSDDELLAFIEENDGIAPSPLLFLNVEEFQHDSPQIVREDEKWEVCQMFGQWESKKALAIRERLGHGYGGLSAEMLMMAQDKTEWSRACPIAPADLPDPEYVAKRKRYAF